MKLTDVVLAQACSGAQRSSITRLVLSHKELHEVSLVKALTNLERLELNHNCLESIEVLSNLRTLKWLSVASNQIKSLSGVESLSNLMVLNASSNLITSMKEVEGLLELRALILNDNQITSICKLQKLTSLNTLVLSKNPICSLGPSLEKAATLVKLSLSNCKLQDLGSLKSLVDLKELRLAHNKIKLLSKDLKKNTQLRIIDLGNNRLQELSGIKVMGALPFLKNLNLRGNPICLHNDYTKKIKSLLPNLKVLDGHALESTGKKRPFEDHSNFSKGEELDKSYLEDSHTAKVVKRLPEGEKSARAKANDLPKDNLHKGRKSKRDEDASKRDQRESRGSHGKARVDTQEDDSPKEDRYEGNRDNGESVIGGQKAMNGTGLEECSGIPKSSIINISDRNGEEVLEDEGLHKRKKLRGAKEQPKRKGQKEAPTKDDDEPFIELIAREEPKRQASKDVLDTPSKKGISGIVSILYNKSKTSKQLASKHNLATRGSPFSVSLPEIDIGAGGLSSWD